MSEKNDIKYGQLWARHSGQVSNSDVGNYRINFEGLKNAIDEALRDAQTGAVWVKAAQKPEHNVGVLVFIPGEDNHITSGMWDISNEWVLLDEYRTPEEEVTHWMPLPAFPEGYTWNEIPNDLVDVLKKVAKEELGKKGTAAGMEPDINELWDEHSELIDDDIDSLTRWAGSSVVDKEQFKKLVARMWDYFKQQKEK